MFIDEVMVTEDVTTTISPSNPAPAAPAVSTNLPRDDPPPSAVTPVAQPPAVTPVGPSIVYTETTIIHEVTTTLVMKRHAHHARGHVHPHRRR